MRKSLGLAFSVVLAFSTAVGAAPLEMKEVAADAKWAAHLDVDALMASTIVQKARAQMLKDHPETEMHLAMVRAIWKVDLTTDIHGITVYGTRLKKGTGAAIVHAKVDQALLLERGKLAPEHRISTYGKYELHNWVHAKGSKHERAMTAAFFAPDVMVFSTSAEEVMAALDVLDGTKPNLAEKEPSLVGLAPEGSFFVGGMIGLNGVELPCQSPAAKQAESMLIAAGEKEGEVFVETKLSMKTPEVAQQMKTAVNGAVALAALAKSDDPDAMKIINGTKVGVTDKVVGVAWHGSADGLWVHLEKLIANKMASHKAWATNDPNHCPLKK